MSRFLKDNEKKGHEKSWEIPVVEPRIATLVRQWKALPGHRLKFGFFGFELSGFPTVVARPCFQFRLTTEIQLLGHPIVQSRGQGLPLFPKGWIGGKICPAVGVLAYVKQFYPGPFEVTVGKIPFVLPQVGYR